MQHAAWRLPRERVACCAALEDERDDIGPVREPVIRQDDRHIKNRVRRVLLRAALQIEYTVA
jgi:hypothetical protein